MECPGGLTGTKIYWSNPTQQPMPNLAPLQKHTYTCVTILPFQTTQQLTNHSWITQESNAIVYTKFLDLHTEVNTW